MDVYTVVTDSTNYGRSPDTITIYSLDLSKKINETVWIKDTLANDADQRKFAIWHEALFIPAKKVRIAADSNFYVPNIKGVYTDSLVQRVRIINKHRLATGPML
jgi:hypothetical protein